MISRIVPFLFVVLFTVPLRGQDSIFRTVGDTQVLTQNLTIDLDPRIQDQILSQIEQEMKASSTPRLRQDSLWMAQGLLYLQKKEQKKGLESFSKVSPTSLIRDATLFYSIKTLRQLGEDALQNKQFVDAKNYCMEAQGKSIDLDNDPSSLYQEDLKNEKIAVRNCLLRCSINLNQVGSIFPWGYGEILGENENSIPLHVDALQYTIRALKEQGLQREANLLIEEEYEKHPNDPKIASLYASRKPTENSKSETKKEKERSDLPYKTRTIPEEKILSDISNKQSQGKYDAAITLCVQLITQYPGSSAVSKAEARLASILDIRTKKKRLTPEAVTQLKRLPPDSLYEAGKTLWQKDQDEDAYVLLSQLISQPYLGSKGGNAYYILGRIDENQGRYEKARTNFKILVNQYSGSSFYENAHFKIGFLSFLMGDIPTAMEWMEYHRTLTRSSYTQAKALYWLGRTSDKANQKQRGDKYREEIGRVAPLSFYSFLVQRMPTFVERNVKTPTKPRSFLNAYALARAKALLAAGLHENGMTLLSSINLEAEPQLMVEIGELYGAIRQYNPAFKIAYNLAEGSPSSEKLPTDVSKLLFPVEYQNAIEKEAKANLLDPLLLFSVIKQESAYRENAESRAGAVGLMQLMPATAELIAKEGKVPFKGKFDLTKGEVNIQLGARYFANTLKKYNGNAIYTIAAYNAGIDRADLWIKQWSQLPTEEFIEMIPFEETRNYVKSIARNYAFYAKLLENRLVELKNLTHFESTASK